MMKYLLVLAVVLVGFYVWRHNRRAEAREAQEEADAAARRQKPAQRPPTLPHRMLTCRHCGLHLPASEAVKGTLGPYCGAEHRRLAEGE
jgi:uncharacterized protein